MTMTVGKTLMMGLIILLRVTGLAATDGDEANIAGIKVRIWDRVHVESETLNRAKNITESLYRRAGIAITWVHCTAELTPENRALLPPSPADSWLIRARSGRLAFHRLDTNH